MAGTERSPFPITDPSNRPIGKRSIIIGMKELMERSVKLSEILKLSELDLPPELDLRNKDEVVDFLVKTVRLLNSKIVGFEKGAFLLVGSVSRNSASNNSDIDVIPIVPTFGFDRVLVKSLFTEIVAAYGIELDGFQNTISLTDDDHLKRLCWFQSMIDDNTVVLASNDEVKKRILRVLNIGSRGNVITQHWSQNHVFDLSIPPNKLKIGKL